MASIRGRNMIYSWRHERLDGDRLFLDTIVIPVVAGTAMFAWQYVWLKVLGVFYPMEALLCYIGLMVPGLMWDRRYHVMWRLLWFIFRFTGPIVLLLRYMDAGEWPSVFVLTLPALALAKSWKPSLLAQESAIVLGLAPLYWLFSQELTALPLFVFFVVMVIYLFLSLY